MKSILIVDDEPTIRRLVRAALDGRGYRLLEAADGPSALETARRERPDLVLLDLALPQLSGTEVCRRLKEAPATADIPVLLLTGMAQHTKRGGAQTAGAQGCIEKPFSPRALTAQIAELLQEAPAPAAS